MYLRRVNLFFVYHKSIETMNDLTSLDNKSLWELHAELDFLLTDDRPNGDLQGIMNCEKQKADTEAEMLNRGFSSISSFRHTSSAFYYGHHATLEEYKQYLESNQ